MSAEDDWETARVVDRLVDGITRENIGRRIRLLATKLAGHTDDPEYRFVLRDGTGPLESYEIDSPGSALSSHLSGLVRALSKAQEFGGAIDDISAWIDALPVELKGRVFVWYLRGSSVSQPERTVQVLASAVESRDPTGDDVRLLEEIETLEEKTGARILAAVASAVISPPPIDALGLALAEGDVPKEWLRAWLWASVLGDSLAPKWDNAKAILDSRYGVRGRDHYRARAPGFEFFSVGSPISDEELAALSPIDAATLVASWRPDPQDFRSSARELGRALERLIPLAPEDWAAEPVQLVAKLHHPTFIGHYLQGLARIQPPSLVDRGPELIEAVQLVATHPWQVIRLGEDDFDYDLTWEHADDAGIELIRSLISHDVSLGEKTDAAWTLVKSAVYKTDRQSGLLSTERDPYQSAINRPCTRAMEALLHFVAAEHRSRGVVRDEVFVVLDWVLSLRGRDALEFRSVLGAKIAFIRYVVPDWVEMRSGVLFGGEAEDGLGLATIKSAVRWAQPNSWLLQRFPDAILGLAQQGDARALDHALIAMLWEEPAYEIDRIYEQLFSNLPALGSLVAERLARLVKPDDVPEGTVERGIAFWEHVLAKDTKPQALKGFGWWTEVRNMPTEHWENLMLRTARVASGRLDWAGQTATRAVEEPLTREGLEIVRLLLHGTEEPWEKAQVAEAARSALESAAIELKASDEYRRLKHTLITLGFG